MPRLWAGNTPYDGRFTFARIKYRGAGHGVGWAHDYPRAESHFVNIIKSITTVNPFVAAGPMLKRRIPVTVGDVVEREGFAFADLLPEQAA